MKKKKSIAALLLAGTMLFSTLPMNALAVESRAATDSLCEHHTRHDADCGYTEGTPCGYICKVCKATDSSLEGSSEENSSEENSSIGNSGVENSDTETTDTETTDTENSDTEKGNPETSNTELQKPVNMDDELELQTVLDLEKSSAAAATLIIGNGEDHV